MMRLDPRYAWMRQLAAFAALLALWEAAARADMLNPMYAPSPSRVGAALIDLFSDGRIWPHLEATFSAALGGLALGIAVGIVLGVVAALVPFIAELLEPVMTVLNAIPRVILAPLFVIWLGIGLASKVALFYILVAVLIFFTVFTGIRQVDRRLVERVITLGGDRWALVRHVYLPSVASWVLGNLKIAVGFAFTGACVGEFVAATQGLGYLLSFAQSTYNAALMFALILLILVVVLVIFGIAGRLEKHVLRWNRGQQRPEDRSVRHTAWIAKRRRRRDRSTRPHQRAAARGVGRHCPVDERPSIGAGDEGDLRALSGAHRPA